jgi:RNA polymerase sigma-70 factor (ECF subfamily)
MQHKNEGMNMLEVKDVQKYVRLAKNNDSDAFILLFKEYEKLIYKIAYTYLGSKDDALDAVQEAAYQSYKNIKSLRKPEYFKTWLCKITTNASLDILKKRQKNDFATTPLDDAIEMIDSPDTAEMTPMEFLDLLTALSENEKNILLLKIYYDYTFEMIANENKMPVGTVKTTYFRMIKKLRLKGAELL